MTTEAAPNRRLAVVLFNLGGPDGPEAVQPFLFNLFNDKAIIGAPAPVRWLLASAISRRRAPVAQQIYARLGGRSPLLEQTRQQAAALEQRLQAESGFDARVFVCMRYWHPMSAETATEVAAFEPDQIVLLPLYPQFSTTTTSSSFADWARAADRIGLRVPMRAVCCYPAENGLVSAQVALIREAYEAALEHGRPRVLFSAHGLPERVIARGDPYAWQVEATAAAVVAGLGIDGLEYCVCYQSRVGPLKWIGPSTEAELERAGRDKVPVVVVPIAFVSEHSETLVELDIEYKERAAALGVAFYARVPAVGTAPAFVEGLANLVKHACGTALPHGEDGNPALCPPGGHRLCPPDMSQCPCLPASAGQDGR